MMTTTLLDKRAELLVQAEALTKLDSFDQAVFDEKYEAIAKIDAQIDAQKKVAKVKKELEGQVDDTVKVVADASKEAGIDHKVYAEAMIKYMAKGDLGLSPRDKEILASVNKTTAGEGGNVVDQLWNKSIIAAQKATGSMLSVATILNTEGGQTLNIPTINRTAQGAAIVAEEGAFTEVIPPFGSTALVVYKYTDLVLLTEEFIQDSFIDFEGWLNANIAYTLNLGQNPHFTTGTGSSQPHGIVTGATSGKTTVSATAFTYSELVDLQYSINTAYQANAKWMMSAVTWAKVMQLLDSSGQPLINPVALAAGAGPTLLGKPVVLNDDVASVATGTKPILYGDFSNYTIRIAGGVTIQRLNELYAANGKIGLRYFQRAGGRLINAGTNPVKFLTMA